jgi:hypothetical protein
VWWKLSTGKITFELTGYQLRINCCYIGSQNSKYFTAVRGEMTGLELVFSLFNSTYFKYECIYEFITSNEKTQATVFHL